MRRFLQKLLYKPVSQLADRFSSRPNKTRVNKALNSLYKSITTQPGKKGLVIPFNAHNNKFIILSDQHKGARDGADIFAKSAKNYLAALDHY
ncbi:metallophosphoesterase, partial [Mucilaginibacter sp. 10I4]|nr:metallophosphoesterase [Mucilaginibacter sp. 10I4]